MEKVYMVCDWCAGNCNGGAMNVGVEYMGECSGRILSEDGSEIGHHFSSTFGWLRYDLLSNLDNLDEYEVVDLIGQNVPERFKLK